MLAFLAVIMAAQALYAGIDIFAEPGRTDPTGSPFPLVLRAGFAAYAAMIVAFVVGIWRQAWWAWHLAVAIATTGLGIAGLRIATGDPFDRHALGMLIDGALLFYLQRRSIKGLFGR